MQKLMNFFRKSNSNRIRDCRNFQVSNNNSSEFCTNSIHTARYSFYSFLPLFLYDQFSKLANVYFLIIGLMEQIPGVSPVGRFITLVPLFILLSVSAFKEAIEDIKRRSSDKKMNNLKCEIFSKYWRRATWGEITVGDIVRVTADQTFPADLIILATSESTQSCYVQTASLDGETNYKIRSCKEQCKDYCNEDYWSKTITVVQCEGPSNNLYKFSGTIKLNNNPPFPVDHEQLILRGSQLKNTHWVVGVVVYTGHETKIMLNSSHIVIKRSTIDYATNWLVLSLLGALLVFTVIFSFLYEINLREVAIHHWYLGLPETIPFSFHLTALTTLILLHNIIPISLIVTLEFIKVIQSYVISHDPLMYSKTSQTNAIVKTSSIIEDLGHINYIFTDKTGTLTCNEMILREISIADQSYKFDDNQSIELDCAFSRTDDDLFHMFMINLLLCNSIIPEYGKNKNDVAYQSSSPDETAIVKVLAEHGYKFMERTLNGVTIEVKGVVEFWKILSVIDFTSERKRMSVIAQSSTDECYIFTKGADNVIMERLKNQTDKTFEATLNYLENFAKNGLRTLCIAYKALKSEECESILFNLNEAFNHISQREHFVEIAANQIEKDLVLLGATGIEDKLQTNVPETINMLKGANIRIWMLTGDKLETAMNIGFSCNLLNINMDIKVLSCTSLEDCIRKLKEILLEKNIKPAEIEKLRTNPAVCINLALVITGQDLTFALDPECMELFLDVAINCESVICCRVSPLQKKNALLMIKERVSETTTLAIGDGANDCSMIRVANVGVGIIGKEGMQAANTADFAIGEFSHLTRLLFVHGAASYRRNTNCIYFCFYKNIVFNLTHFFFNFFTMYSGQVIFSKLHMALFNVSYTSLPPLCFGLLDQSCSLEAHYNVPYLYQSLRKSSPFGIKRFFCWTMNGVIHSFFVFFLCYFLCHKGVISGDGIPISIGLFGNIVFMHTLIVITLKAALELRFWFWMSHIGIFVGFVFYLMFLAIFSRRFPPMIWIEPEFFETDLQMIYSLQFWVALVGLPVISLFPDFVFHCIRNTWFMPSYLLVTEIERNRSINWTEPENIRTIQSELDRSCEIKSRRTKKYFGFAFSVTENVNLKKFFPRHAIKPKPASYQAIPVE